MTVGVVVTVSTPFFWLLDNPDAGQFVAASVQGFTGVAAVVLALFQTPAAAETRPADTAINTGKANATGGGTASTGIRRSRRLGSGSASAERTGDATADGSGSNASTGIDYS